MTDTPQQLAWALRGSVPDGRLEAQPVPLAPAIALYLLAADYPRGPLPQAVVGVIMAQPAYWAFCWASGQALARHVLDHPALVAGKRVLDFGSGSGVVAIAAARAGGATVTACDNDATARLATRVNAAHNGVDIDVIAAVNLERAAYDVVLMADVLYDITNLPLLARFTQVAHDIVIADSRVKSIPLPGIAVIAHYETATVPDLDESPEYRNVSIYHWSSANMKASQPPR